jgi:hypothetical protein
MLRWIGALVVVAAAAVSGSLPADAASDPPAPEWGGPRTEPVAVRPPSSSPIADVSRDCGFSVELRDGNALWIYCDSSDAAVGAEPTWFINNSAALARAGSPLVMLEPLDGNQQPYPFIVPTAYDPCGAYDHIIWPTSAVVVPSGPVDRVLVYFENVCRVGGEDIFGVESHSIGLAEYRYVPGTTPTTGPIRATVLAPSLWPSRFGHASVVRNGYVYVYQCDYDWGEPWGCRVGRAAAAVADDPAQYRYWDGSTFVQYRSNAVFMAMPGTDTPGAAYQVAYVAEWDAYAMTYIAWPGIGGTQKVRIATSPRGPWSDALSISLPGCGEPDYCYAGAIHTQLTDARSLGLGYYDPNVAFSDRPAAGQVRSYSQPVFPPFQERWTFWDVPPEHPFAAPIEAVAAAGIAQGYADTWFHPTDPVSRQAMAAFLQRTVDGTIPAPGPPTFADVPLDNPFFGEVEWATAAGIAQGYPDGTFRPAEVVTRQAIAAFLHRLAGSPAPGGAPPTFADVPPGHPFAAEIAWLVDAGIADGYPDGTFRPEVPVSRQVMAAVLDAFAACCAP